MHVVTLIHPRHLTASSLLVESVRESDPDVVIHGLSCHPTAIAPDGVQMIAPSGLRSGELTFIDLLAAASPDEIEAIAMPLAMRHVLTTFGAPVVFLAPHVELLASPDQLADLAPPRSGLTFFRRSAPLQIDDRRPDDLDLVTAGPLSDSVVFAAAGAETAIDRWLTMAEIAWIRGESLHTRDVSTFLTSDDSRCAIADGPQVITGWDVGVRRFASDGGRLLVDGQQVVAIDFTGHDRAAPHRALAGEGRTRRPLGDEPAIARYYHRRDERLRTPPPVDPPASAEVVPGVTYDDVMVARYRRSLRRAIIEGADRPPNPLTDGVGFLGWIAASDHGGPIPVSRYVEEIRAGRADLLDAFPEVPGRSVPDLLRWVLEHGQSERDIPPMLLPEEPPPPQPPAYQQPGVNLAGFLTAELGVGEVARRIATSLDAASVPYGTYTFERTASRRAAVPPPDRTLRYDTNIICVNADSIGSFVQTVGPSFSVGRHRIGVWFWETADLPGMFHPAIGNLDELWAASDFVADALRAAAPPEVPVVRFPLPIVVPPTDPSFDRGSLGLPPDRYLFLFSFDYLSVAERKNPFGVVEAFRAAFSPDEGPVLVIKSINGDKRPDDADRLRWFSRDRDDIVLRDGYLDAPENAALTSLADTFISLHRSEGFGFNLADAIALGTPVIGTRYSGNLTFMHDDDCSMVRYHEIPVGPDHFPYLATSVWADPDLDHAASLMRSHVDDPAAARVRAEQARERALREFSPLATGEFVRNRLAAVRADRPDSTSPTTAAAGTLLRRVRRLVDQGIRTSR